MVHNWFSSMTVSLRRQEPALQNPCDPQAAAHHVIRKLSEGSASGSCGYRSAGCGGSAGGCAQDARWRRISSGLT